MFMKAVVTLLGVVSGIFLTSKLIPVLQTTISVYRRTSRKSWVMFQIIGMILSHVFALVFISYMIYLGFYQ